MPGGWIPTDLEIVVRDKMEIQHAHDLLTRAISPEFTPAVVGIKDSHKEKYRIAKDVLCWVLRHGEPKDVFSRILIDLKAQLAAQGIELEYQGRLYARSDE